MRTNVCYQKIMTIVHGKSEFSIYSNIKSNLRLPQEIIANNKGRSSIQITGLMNVLNDNRFKNIRAFKNEYSRVEAKKNELVNFQLFIIMDTDDCTDSQRTSFIDKSMFKSHWLYPYIVPIYNSPNLEQTMKEANIPIVKKSEYIQIFPTNHGDLDLNKAKEFLESLRRCKNSNMSVYVERCIQLSEENILRRK